MSKMSKEWHAAYSKKWHAAHKKEGALSAARWRARNPEKVKEQGRAPSKLAYSKLWAKRNREKRKATEIKWREANKERYLSTQRERNRRYRASHLEIGRLAAQRRRERARSVKQCDKAGANVLCQLISDVPRLKCGICGKNMPKSDRTIDHVIPLSKGGTGEIWNLRIVHMVCNNTKNAKMPDELNFTVP